MIALPADSGSGCEKTVRMRFLGVVVLLVLRPGVEAIGEGPEGPGEGLNDLFGMIGDLAGGMSKGCHYTCPSGVTPVPKAEHTPSSNGCGSYGIKVDLRAYPKMTACCDKHDYCYDTCGEDKADCDDEFRRCLKKVCKKMNEKGLFERNQFLGCKGTVDLIYGGLLGLGCDAYMNSQRDACSCPTEGNRPYKEDL